MKAASRLVSGRSLSALFALVPVALVLGACAGPERSTSEIAPTTGRDASPVVARLGDLAITVAAVDARVLALPPAQRPAPGENLDEWMRGQIREVAVEHSLLEWAAEESLDQAPIFVEALRATEKRIGVQLCLAELKPDIGHVDEEALRAEFEARKDQLAASERRFVYHLFLRFERDSEGEVTDTEIARRRSEMAVLRDRVLAGESFAGLAAAHSDSETRHRDGALEWMVPGDLPARFERVVFEIEPGVPSEAIAASDGLHMFYVDQALPARQLQLEEARPILLRQLTAQRWEAALAEIESEIDAPPGSVLLDRAAFDAVVTAGDESATVLTVGDFELDLAGLKAQLRQSQARQDAGSRPSPNSEAAWRLLTQLRRRELLHRHCSAMDRIPSETLTDRVQEWRRRALLDLARQRRLVEIAKRDEERLRLFYQSEIGSFSTPPQWHLRILRVPIDGTTAPIAMPRLERAAADSREQAARLENLAIGAGGTSAGEIRDLGFVDLVSLSRQDPRAPAFVAPLETGQLSAPYRAGEDLVLFEVVDRRDAAPRAFEEVEELVAASYVRQFTKETYAQLREEILHDEDLEILPEGLAMLTDVASFEHEVSVEQLDELLGDL